MNASAIDRQRQVIGLSMVLICVMLSAAAQIFLKVSMLEFSQLDQADWTLVRSIIEIPLSRWLPCLLWLSAGLLFYLLSMYLWIRLLEVLDLSLAYAVLSLNYVLVYVVATHWLRLGEMASTQRTTGIVLIVIGVLVVMSSTGDKGLSEAG